MNNIGKIIKNEYCNGFAGRVYNLEDSRIESEGYDYIVLRKVDNTPEFIYFGDFTNQKQKLIDNWCDG